MQRSLAVKNILSASCCALAFFLAASCIKPLTQTRPASPHKNAEAEVRYLPRGDFLTGISFGYRNVLANVIWFNTLNYFGKHRQSDQNYQWLHHMCSLITQLKPQEIHFFEFCAHMLSWEANQADHTISILNRAIMNHPKRWEFFYLRGFTYYYFLNDLQSATADFVAAAKLPGVHPIVTRLAAQKLMTTNSNASAIEFLENTLATTTEPSARAALESRLRELLVVRDVEDLNRVIKQLPVEQQHSINSLSDLVNLGILRTIPREPFGGEYRLNLKTGQVESSSHQGQKLLARMRKKG